MSERGGFPDGYETEAGSDGSYVLAGIKPGTYILRVFRDRYLPQEFGSLQKSGHGVPLSLGQGQSLERVDVCLTFQAVVTGKVVDEEGEPVLHSIVSLARLMYRRGKRTLIPLKGTTTNDLGEYRFYDVEPGHYYVTAEPPRNSASRTVSPYNVSYQSKPRTYRTTYYPSATDADSGSSISVAAGAQISGIDIALLRSKEAPLTGIVYGVNSGARLQIVLSRKEAQISSLIPVSHISSTDGKFDVEHLAPGAYIVAGEAVSEGRHYTGRVEVTIAESPVDGVQLRLAQDVLVHGRVVTRDSGPVPSSIRVVLEPQSDLFRPATFSIPSGGEFSGVVPAQELFDISVVGLPDDWCLMKVSLGQREITDSADLVSFGSDYLSVVVGAPGASLQGSVTKSGGTLAAGATIVAIPLSTSKAVRRVYKRAVSDQAGHYRLSGLGDGSYVVVACEDLEDGAAEDPAFIEHYRVSAKHISLSGPTPVTMDLSLAASDTSVGN